MGLFLSIDAASFSLRMGQFPNSVAAHPHTKEAEVTHPPETSFIGIIHCTNSFCDSDIIQGVPKNVNKFEKELLGSKAR